MWRSVGRSSAVMNAGSGRRSTPISTSGGTRTPRRSSSRARTISSRRRTCGAAPSPRGMRASASRRSPRTCVAVRFRAIGPCQYSPALRQVSTAHAFSEAWVLWPSRSACSRRIMASTISRTRAPTDGSMDRPRRWNSNWCDGTEVTDGTEGSKTAERCY